MEKPPYHVSKNWPSDPPLGARDGAWDGAGQTVEHETRVVCWAGAGTPGLLLCGPVRRDMWWWDTDWMPGQHGGDWTTGYRSGTLA